MSITLAQYSLISNLAQTACPIWDNDMRIEKLTSIALLATIVFLQPASMLANPSDLPGGLHLSPTPLLETSIIRSPYIEYHQPTRRGPAVIMISDHGPIAELTVTCRAGQFGIVSYSKIEKLFCDPHLRCDRNFDVVFQRTCN